MDEHEENFKDIFRYTDVEYTPDGYSDVYRWDDFLGIAGGHVYSAMDTIDSVSPGGEYEGDEPEHAYACEIVACCGLSDGVALFRPVSHDGADLIQVAFLRNDVDDATGAYTERFEAGSFDLPAADFPRSESGVDLLEYFSGRSFKHTPGVSRGLDPREAVDSIEDAIGCDLGLFDGFWLGVPGEADMRVGPYTKKSLLDFSYYAKELSCRYGFADSDILEIARHLPEDFPDRFAAVKAYLDCKYTPDGDAPDEKTYRWGDFLEIAGGMRRWTVSVNTNIARPDLPKQRIKLEIASVPAHTSTIRRVAVNYPELDGMYDNLTIRCQTLEEILADKLISFSATDTHIRHRDLWDIPWIVRAQEIDFSAVAALVAAKHADYRCPASLASMIAVGMQRAHVCYADGSFTGQMQRFLSPAVLNRTHDFDNHCDALNTIVEKCFGRVVTSLGISNDVERARRRLATEISLGSISAAVLPKRTLGLS